MLDAEYLIKVLELNKKNRVPSYVKGNELISCCPFKHYKNGIFDYEHNPSFGINLVTGEYNCFSCGVKGKTIDSLFYKLGKTLDLKYVSRNNDFKSTEVLYSLDFYTKNFDKAREYFLNRGVDINTIKEKIKIGATFDGSSLFFPVIFGNDYWIVRRNTRDNPRWSFSSGFPRNNLLYGDFHVSGGFVFVVESITDRIFLEANGYNAVSTFGSHVSDVQLELLLTFNYEKFILVPHHDQAGKKWLQFFNKIKYRLNLYMLEYPEEFKDIFDYKLINLDGVRKL